jgi:hypothetical protein
LAVIFRTRLIFIDNFFDCFSASTALWVLSRGGHLVPTSLPGYSTHTHTHTHKHTHTHMRYPSSFVLQRKATLCTPPHTHTRTYPPALTCNHKAPLPLSPLDLV